MFMVVALGKRQTVIYLFAASEKWYGLISGSLSLPRYHPHALTHPAAGEHIPLGQFFVYWSGFKPSALRFLVQLLNQEQTN